MQVEAVPWNCPEIWQELQAWRACAPLSGKRVCATRAPFQVAVVWQVSQVWGKPAAAWFGFRVALYFVRWQEAHRGVRPANCPLAWQLVQPSVWCTPVNGNRVREWSALAPRKVVVE